MASHGAGSVNHVTSRSLLVQPGAQSDASPTGAEEEEDGGKVWEEEKEKGEGREGGRES